MSRVTEVRLTLAAFLYAIEIDLKSLIDKYLIDQYNSLDFLKDDILKKKIEERYLKEYPSTRTTNNISDVIDFLDYQDRYTVLLKNKNSLPENVYRDLKALVPHLEKLTSVRNRVMHTRPLHAGDFSTVYSFVQEIDSTEIGSIAWNSVKDTKVKIEQDPSYVLTLSLPTFKRNNEEAFNNLPIPDFDDTGFIGRKKDVEDVKKLILGNQRVVSIIGDGGIGKTALALKVAYEILDLGNENPFDIIIWVSAKTTMLTTYGIKEIQNTLVDYGGFIKEIADVVDPSDSDRIDMILEYLELFDVLLIVDNLETILSEDVREFIRKASHLSKLVITSRIGLGELEFRRNLKGLSKKESIILVRQFATLKQSELLNRLDNSKLSMIAEKLHYNPLALKWFVNSVESGIKPEEVLNNKDNLLNFCLSNVYSKISEQGKQIINTLLAARRNLNDAELIFLTEMPSIQLRRSLNELFSTTFISREISNASEGQEVKYMIPEFAKEYILKKHPVSKETILSINKKLRKLNIETSSIERSSNYNEFGLYSLLIRNSNEKVIAKLILEALKMSKTGDYNSALNKLTEARDILPDYFEVYRVSAFIKARSGDFLGAEEDYKIGLEMEPENPRMLYFYSGFLLYQLNDAYNAFSFAKKLHEIRPQSPLPTFLFARILSSVGENKRAVELATNLIKYKKLNKQNLRVAKTDLIGIYCHWAEEIIQKEGDYAKSKQLFVKGLKIFEKSFEDENFDKRMIKNFCKTLIKFIKIIPKIQNEDNVDYIKDLLIKYDEQISISESKTYILNLLEQNYGVKLNYQPKLIGVVSSVNFYRGFIFIRTKEGEEIYGNKKAFKYSGDFSSIKKGNTVKFDLGSNKMGKCAVNIRLN